jgi:hypothetical protein
MGEMHYRKKELLEEDSSAELVACGTLLVDAKKLNLSLCSSGEPGCELRASAEGMADWVSRAGFAGCEDLPILGRIHGMARVILRSRAGRIITIRIMDG